MKITINIDDGIYGQIRDAVKDLTGPPQREGNQFITPLLYPNPVEDWLAEVVGQNIGNIVRHRPTPQMQELQTQVAALENQVKLLLRPAISIEK